MTRTGNPFLIYPKFVSTLRLSDQIYSKNPFIKKGIYTEQIDDNLYIISVYDFLCECLVVDSNDNVIDGYVKRLTNFKYKNKLIKDYLDEEI